MKGKHTNMYIFEEHLKSVIGDIIDIFIKYAYFSLYFTCNFFKISKNIQNTQIIYKIYKSICERKIYRREKYIKEIYIRDIRSVWNIWKSIWESI